MSSIDDLVDIQISAETAIATTPSFGIVAVVAEDAGVAFTELYRTYTSVDDIDGDADFTSVAGKRLAKLVLQQDPTCGTVVVINAHVATIVDDVVQALTDAVQAGVDFFGVVLEDNADATIILVAAWAETNKKLFVAAPKPASVAAYDATATALTTSAYRFTLSMVSKDNNAGDLGAAVLGRCFAANPGAINWTHRRLSGVVADTFTSTEIAALKAQKSGWYETVAGLNMTRGGSASYEGWASHGSDFPDITRGTEWLSAAIQAAVVTLKSRVDKIPMTDVGGAMIYNAIRPILSQAESPAYNLLAPGTTLYVPPVSEIPDADRAARRFTGIVFNGVYQGAVNQVRIRGRVTV